MKGIPCRNALSALNYIFFLHTKKKRKIKQNKTSKGKMVIFLIRVMVFIATFNNISVISRPSVLLVEKTGVPGENHRPAASH